MKLLSVFLCMLVAVNAGNYMSSASSMFIKVMTNYKQPNIDAGRASSEANKFWTDIAKYPAFAKICNDMSNEQFNMNDMDRMKQVGIKYGHDGINAFNQWKAGPSYSPYVQYVSQHIRDFDVSRFISDATQTMNQYWPFVRGAVSRNMRDPQVKQLASTVALLAPKVIKDTGLEPYLRNIRPPPGFAPPNYQYGGDHAGYEDDHYHNL